MEAKDIIVNQYLPFAKETIVARSITYIDGLKPVQRRVLWAMYQLDLLKNLNITKKAARIVGDTMGKYHPHGDSAIYQAACAMASNYEGNNAAFIRGKGNVGKKYSNPKLGGLHAAAQRYSEFGFMPLAKELFDGLNDNAVNFIPNFDDTDKEPEILPISFPSCIVNMNKGIAVGLGSTMPCYTIENACLATAKFIQGDYKDDMEIVKLLGVPDFPCECRVHYDDNLLYKLYTTGRASFKCTSTFHVNSNNNEIIVDSVPPTTTFEAVIKQIKAYALSAESKDIVDVITNIGMGTKGISIKVRPSTDVGQLMTKLYAKTDLLSTISFYSQIIWKKKPEQVGVKKVLEYWTQFRDECLVRVYRNKLSKKAETAHKLEAWAKIKDSLADCVDILVKNNEADATKLLKKTYNLDDIQCKYLLDLPVRNVCTDNAKKQLEKYAALKEEIEGLQALLADKTARYQIIIQDLMRIAKEYKEDRKSSTDGLISMDFGSKKRDIPDTLCTVFVTSKGYIKAIDDSVTSVTAEQYLQPEDSLMFGPIYARKNEHLLVYTYAGICYKILVNNIEHTKGKFKQKVWDLVDRKDTTDVFYVTKSGKYTEQFAIIYGSGRGKIVDTAKVSGKQKVYKNQFDAGVEEYGHQNTLMLLPFDRFVLVTARKKAAMGCLDYMRKLRQTGAFKVTRITDDDALIRVLNASNYPAYIEKGYLDPEKYVKGYPVSYGNDPISYLDKPVEEFETAWAEWQKTHQS